MKYPNLCMVYTILVCILIFVTQNYTLCDEKAEIFILVYVWSKMTQINLLQFYEKNMYLIVTIFPIFEIIAGYMYIDESCDLQSQQIFQSLYWFSIITTSVNIMCLSLASCAVFIGMYYMMIINRYKQNIE